MKFSHSLAALMACLCGIYADYAFAFVVGGGGVTSTRKSRGIVGLTGHKVNLARSPLAPSPDAYDRVQTNKRGTSTTLGDVFDELEVSLYCCRI